MAGKSDFFQKQLLNRAFRRLTTAVSASNASQSNILVTSSVGFIPGDFVKITADNGGGAAATFHQVTAVPDVTHVTISPNTISNPVTTGNVEAWAYSPIAVYMALYTVAPTDTTAGTEVSTSGTNYGRIAITKADGSWSAPTGAPSSTTNSGIITFGIPSGAWGSVVASALVDTASGTCNILYWDDFTGTAVNLGDPAPTFPIAGAQVTED
jgi:hypothetical protein